jgi:hypothetical protein
MTAFYFINGDYIPVPNVGNRNVNKEEKVEKSNSEELDQNSPVE